MVTSLLEQKGGPKPFKVNKYIELLATVHEALEDHYTVASFGQGRVTTTQPWHETSGGLVTTVFEPFFGNLQTDLTPLTMWRGCLQISNIASDCSWVCHWPNWGANWTGRICTKSSSTKLEVNKLHESPSPQPKNKYVQCSWLMGHCNKIANMHLTNKDGLSLKQNCFHDFLGKHSYRHPSSILILFCTRQLIFLKTWRSTVL